jgi:hypothetical protein
MAVDRKKRDQRRKRKELDKIRKQRDKWLYFPLPVDSGIIFWLPSEETNKK